MIGTKGLELTNFINPDLTWNTSKGYRTGTRRSRKQIGRSPKSDADLPDKGIESPSDTTVSESEKLGVAVLGQRFSDKVEHVPIKKRRFTVRSRSPPRYFTPQKKDHESFGEDKKSCKKSNSKKQLFPVDAPARRRKTTHIYSEDFSGIEILAAAACSNNMGDDVNLEDSLMEETSLHEDKLVMALPLEERILSKETALSSPTDTVLEGAEGPVSQNTDSSHNGPADDIKNGAAEKTVERSVSSKDVRLHWDLNVEMDAWETPCETNSRTKGLEDGQNEKLQVLVTPVKTIKDHVELREETIDVNEIKRVPTEKVLKCSTSFGIVTGTSQNLPNLVSDSVKVSVLSEGTDKLGSVNRGVKLVGAGGATGAQQSMDEKLESAAFKMEITLLGENGDLKLVHKVGVDHTKPTYEGALASVPKVESSEENIVVITSVDEVRKNSGDGSGGIATEDTKDESHSFNASDKDHNSKGFDTGYDSQYEDGELREDAPPYWEDVDYEESVDYGSDTCDDANAFSMPSKFGIQLDCGVEEFRGRERSTDRNLKAERVFGSGYDGVCEHDDVGDGMRQKPVGGLKVKMSGSDEFTRGSELSSSNGIAEAPDSSVIRKHSADGLDGKDSPANAGGSGASWKEHPCIGESLSSDTSNRNDSGLVQRSRSSNLDFYSQSEEACADHPMGKGRTDLQMRSKSPGGPGNPLVGYWDSRRRESPTFRGSFGSDRSRPRSSFDNRGGYMNSDGVGGGVSGPDSYGHRQPMNSFSNGSYRYPIRRRSPGSNRDDAHNTHRGMLPIRDGSPDRRKFRRYPQGVGRGFREYHQRPLPPNDSDEFSHHAPNRMFRRDQTSPAPNRGPVYRRPYKRSQSRSRSRSPGAWHDASAKHRNNSRSPDYRFEARMPRMRLPFQKQSFGAKYEVGFESPQRRRFSPQHNNRWFDDQNGEADNFRGRRVPARPFQRFDSVGSSRRMNSDDYYEPPAMRPARFSDMGRGRGGGGGNGGPRRYDVSDDERRRPDGGRYEMYPRVKRCDSDGLRRARFDEEDSFVSRNNSNNNYNNDNDNNNNSGGERRPRSVFMGELVKRKAN